MSLNVYVVVAFPLLVLLLCRRLFAAKPFFRRYSLIIDSVLFLAVLVMLSLHFYERNLKAGLLAVALGAIAIGKYLFDKRKNREEN